MKYSFFYDETEHSRKISYKTITASNYYDNFVTAIVGWNVDKERRITDRYLAFEEKYGYRKKNGELKSQTINIKDFSLGFASLNNNKIGFYEDFISLFDEDIILYFSVSSKIEYIIDQLFTNYHSSAFIDADYAKYSIVKAINIYRPQKLIEALYKEPSTFVDELRFFLKGRIEENKKNKVLKEHENKAFEEILLFIDDAEILQTFDWSYLASFIGFQKLLKEMGIDNYSVIVDREGDKAITAESARYVGLVNVEEGDSKKYVGIRMADMIVGMVSRFMQSLSSALRCDYSNGEINKTLLEPGWFELNQRQLNLYKMLYKVICVDNKYWYKVYAGRYSDDLVAFISLLDFMNHFADVDEIRREGIEIQPEYYNARVCAHLQERYMIMGNKLPVDFITVDDNDFFLNKKGAKVYKDAEKHRLLPIHEGQNRYNVLSVGVANKGIPLITVAEKDNPVCYRLPDEYGDWAMTVVGMANLGENFFPAEVIFSFMSGKYYVDII
ncbi:DUF3800 domain-containing protein [Butyrivibrio sp. M55]|uniref:DUF3800 domain-containing protein n=1 Tax=Butyrivibrio sp. M55 TaxID=1855323 RepID=UPI0008EB7D9F|nr:DUF3800 domain-containing protein [Butyrivibrio sp. M55]SFU57280.1 hypothetical protein SAMN05216540_1046 [Butyrivibrio sp. M55]